jgi:NhaP-type Na+/H+ or K+/H+ antiporter
MMPPLGARWAYTDLALCGALAGTLVVLALNVWSILSGRFDASDPFIHVMTETIGSAAAGAVLSIVLGLVHRRFLHRM